MASLRKRFSRWALGESDQKQDKSVDTKTKRGSLDSGYYSSTSKQWNETSDRPSNEKFLKSPPGKLHKALSMTFDYLADTVRQGASSLHQDPEKKEDPETPIFTTPKETPKKPSRRSSLFSSVRSRRSMFSPKSREVAMEASQVSEQASTPTRVSSEKAPVLDVDIPPPSFNNEGSQRIESQKLEPTAKVLWPSPTKVATGSNDLYINRDDLSLRVRNFVNSALSAPSSPVPAASSHEDKGYIAESESNAERSDGDVFSSPRSHHAPPVQSQSLMGSAGGYEQAAPQVEVDHRSNLPSSMFVPPRLSSNMDPKSPARAFLGRCHSETTIFGGCLPSDVYEADAEVSEESPNDTPNMGSRALWERVRADRDRRYRAAIEGDANSDVDAPLQGQSPDWPKSSAASSQAQTSPQYESSSSPIIGSPTPGGVLRYAVEAANRCCGSRLPSETESQSKRLEKELPTALSTQDQTLADPKTQDNQKTLSDSNSESSDDAAYHLFSILQPDDAYEAGLRAAGLSAAPHAGHSWASIETLGQSSVTLNTLTRCSTPANHRRSASNISEATTDSCAITTNSPSCWSASLPYRSLHMRSEPSGLASPDMTALNNPENSEIPIRGPADTSIEALSSKNPGSDPAQEKPLPSPIKTHNESLTIAEDSKSQLVVEDKVGTPHKTFNASRLPLFDSPSPSQSSLKGKSSLRQKKNKRRVPREMRAYAANRLPLSEAKGNIAKREEDLEKLGSPQFSVRQFDYQQSSGDYSPYPGHQLDPVSYMGTPPPKRTTPKSPLSAKELAHLLKNAKADERNNGTEQQSLDKADSSDEMPALVWPEQDFQEEQRGMRCVEVAGFDDPGEHTDKENINPEKRAKAEKPRWRIPSKVTES
ncbi:hypothetical protein ACLMJK_004501 [Lecanora helva]